MYYAVLGVHFCLSKAIQPRSREVIYENVFILIDILD